MTDKAGAKAYSAFAAAPMWGDVARRRQPRADRRARSAQASACADRDGRPSAIAQLEVAGDGIGVKIRCDKVTIRVAARFGYRVWVTSTPADRSSSPRRRTPSPQ